MHQSGDSSELAPRLPYKGKSVRNRGVSQTMPFLVIPRSLLRGGFIKISAYGKKYTSSKMRALSSHRVRRLTRLSGLVPLGILVATLGSWVLLLPTIPLMNAASVVKCRETVPVGWPGYPCVKASRMARYRRRLSLIVCSFWMGRSFQRVYDEPTSEVLISK